MRIKQLIYLLPLILPLISGKSTKVQTVLLHGGPTQSEEDPLSSPEMEDIPPQEEWFRVRGDDNHQHKSVSYREPHVVLLSPRTPQRVVVNAVGDRRTGNEQIIGRSGLGNHNDPIQVNVRTHGRVGFQNTRSMKKSSDEEEVFTRRIGENDYEEISKVPSSGRHLQRNSNRGSSHSPAISINSRQQVPREPDKDLVEEDRQDNRKENENGRQQHQVKASRMGDGDEVEYEYDDINDSRSRINEQVDTVPARTPIKTSRDRSRTDGLNPPPHEQVAKMARYIVHNSNWTSIATMSTLKAVRGFPFANVFSVSDGPVDDSSGVPYMYLTPLDMSATDLKQDSRASLTMSLAQSNYCREQNYDPEDPRCAHVILSGRIIPVTNHDEKAYARNSLFTRHPDMVDWPKDHGWYFAKMNIQNILVLDYFGGAKTVLLDDYFHQ